MTSKDVINRINENKIDNRVIRNAVRLRGLVTVLNEKSERVKDYQEALNSGKLQFKLTRRGSDLLHS